jgi:hypothetical protein
MATSRICQRCGKPLSSFAPDGLCPNCLIESTSTLGPTELGEAAPSGDPLPRLRQFGNYELLEEIARGGMGVVYKARQVTLNRTVAVKMILAGRLAGRPPFLAETPMETMVQVASAEPVPLRRLDPSVPRDLETIVLKCLEKEPTRRYLSAQDLADELGRFQRDEPTRARPIGTPEKLWRWCQRKPVLASLYGFLMLLLSVALLGWPQLRQRLDRQVEARSDYLRARAQAQARSDSLRVKDIPARNPACPPEAIDLTDYYNAGLTTKWHGKTAENTLAELPRGVQQLAGVAFDVRGLIQLGSDSEQSRGFPQEVGQIKVGRPVRRFHFLHAVSERPRGRKKRLLVPTSSILPTASLSGSSPKDSPWAWARVKHAQVACGTVRMSA